MYFLQAELLETLGLDVTVTRRQDATFAPNGYIYNVYFDDEAQVCPAQTCSASALVMTQALSDLSAKPF